MAVVFLLIAIGNGMLHSDLPRRWLERTASRSLGATVSIGRLYLDPAGRTAVQDLVLRTQPEGLEILRVDRIDLAHGPLLRALLTGSAGLKDIHVSGVRLTARRNKEGPWNFQPLIASLGSLPSGTTDPTAKDRWPNLHISHVHVEVQDANGLGATLPEVLFTGQQRDKDQWDFHCACGTGLRITGHVTLNPAMDHTVTFQYQDTDSAPADWFKTGPRRGAIQGRWSGRLAEPGLTGTLNLEQVDTAGLQATGIVAVRACPAYVALDANLPGAGGLTVQSIGGLKTPILVQSGTIKWLRPKGRLAVNALTAQGLGGSVQLNADVPLDRPTRATGQLKLDGLDLRVLADAWSRLEGLSGGLSGTITASPATSANAPEPMALDVRLTGTEARYLAGDIKGFSAMAYVGPNRMILDKASLEAFKGVIRLWARTTQRADERFSYLSADFNDIDLPEVLKSLSETGEVSGRLSGSGTLITTSEGLSGDADIRLDDTDLLNSRLFGILYDALNLKFLRKDKNVGQGRVRLSLEGRKVLITNFEYINRGQEIRGAGAIEDVTRGKASPIQGYAVGLARPIRELKIPGIKELDRLMSSLQKDAVTIEISGTLGVPQSSIVPFIKLQSAVKALLWNQLGGRGTVGK